MMDLRERAHAVELLEQDAGEKAGLRMRLMDEAALLGNGGKDYARALVEQLIGDMTDELKAAAGLGVELGNAVKAARAKKAKG